MKDRTGQLEKEEYQGFVHVVGLSEVRLRFSPRYKKNLFISVLSQLKRVMEEPTLLLNLTVKHIVNRWVWGSKGAMKRQ